jgi:phosphate transport system substrate-binding protein
VADLVAKTPNSLGYVEFFYALEHRLSYASVRNRSGQFVQADLTTLSAAAVNAKAASSGDLRVSIVNAPSKNAYPIAAFTYLLAPVAFKGATEGAAMKEFLAWMLDRGRSRAGRSVMPHYRQRSMAWPGRRRSKFRLLLSVG